MEASQKLNPEVTKIYTILIAQPKLHKGYSSYHMYVFEATTTPA